RAERRSGRLDATTTDRRQQKDFAAQDLGPGLWLGSKPDSEPRAVTSKLTTQRHASIVTREETRDDRRPASRPHRGIDREYAVPAGCIGQPPGGRHAPGRFVRAVWTEFGSNRRSGRGPERAAARW